MDALAFAEVDKGLLPLSDVCVEPVYVVGVAGGRTQRVGHLGT